MMENTANTDQQNGGDWKKAWRAFAENVTRPSDRGPRLAGETARSSDTNDDFGGFRSPPGRF